MERLNVPLSFEELRARWSRLAPSGDTVPANPPDGREGCEVCEGAGWWKNAEGRYARCSCIVSLSTAPGVPLDFRGVTLGNMEIREGQEKAIAKAREFASDMYDPHRDLYLTGGVGAGKTRLACAIANDCYRRGLMVQFERVPLLLHQLQPGRDTGELEERLMTVHVAVFDDIGAERDQATDYTRRTLLMLYEARHDRGLRTVFTSNKSIQELADMQDDDRLTSRIAGRADVVRLTTSDQRLRRGK